MSESSPVQRTWQCQCGAVKLQLTGEPDLLLNCVCHSCVSSARMMAEKGGTSWFADDFETCVFALYNSSKMDMEPGALSKDGTSLLKFCKVGDEGKVMRSYTTCCGSAVCTLPPKPMTPKILMLNRNGIKEADGSKYAPPPEEQPVANWNASSAFVDYDQVPDPKIAKQPILKTMKFMFLVMNPFFSSMYTKGPELEADPTEAEVIPITWE